MITILATCYLLLTANLFVYSYGFLDFNLTLSSHPLFLQFVAPLQHIVYFDRPHSNQVYVFIFTLLTILYFTALRLYRNANSRRGFPWKIFGMVVLILTLAYPMLSYDVFNYMFHQKILWFYHANPHLHAPLEYQGDLWLRFMRWVHTPSAYGPVFTLVEAPAYLLGFGKFVPTLYLMKATMASFFVWAIYLIGRVGGLRAQLMIAFNPFLLLELVVNAHNDAVMITLLILAIYLTFNNKTKLSLIALTLSIGVKYITALALPAYLMRDARFKIILIALLLYLPILVSPGRFQPWYLVWPLLPAALIDTSWSRLWIILTSLAGLIFYIPYIATGFWNNSTLFVSLILYFPPILTIATHFLRSQLKPSL